MPGGSSFSMGPPSGEQERMDRIVRELYYPGEHLGPQLRDPKECLSAFTVLRRAFFGLFRTPRES